MKEFIGNPFQQEFEEDDEWEEFEFEDVIRTFEAEAERIIEPPEDEEEDDDILILPETDEDDDPDYNFESNDEFDTDVSQHFEDVSPYVLRGFDSDDEEDEELDYVTFPISGNNSLEPASKTTEESNASNSDRELPPAEEETWD